MKNQPSIRPPAKQNLARAKYQRENPDISKLTSLQLAARYPANKLDDLTPLLEAFRQYYPAYLPQGVMGVAETKMAEPFFNFIDGRFFVSGITVDGINPKEVLLSAFKAIRTGANLDITQEKVVAGFWHEMVHQQQFGLQQIIANEKALTVAETVTEFIARFTYPRFLKALGTTPSFQGEIVRDSIGYQTSMERFYAVLNKLNINPNSLLAPLETMNKKDMGTLTNNLTTLLATTGRDATAIRDALENLYLKKSEENQFQILLNRV